MRTGYPEDGEVKDDIPIFVASALVVTMGTADSARNYGTDSKTRRGCRHYDIWSELNDDGERGIAESSVPISIREVVYLQQTYRFCQQIHSGNGQSRGQFFETYDIVLRRISPR